NQAGTKRAMNFAHEGIAADFANGSAQVFQVGDDFAYMAKETIIGLRLFVCHLREGVALGRGPQGILKFMGLTIEGGKSLRPFAGRSQRLGHPSSFSNGVYGTNRTLLSPNAHFSNLRMGGDEE